MIHTHEDKNAERKGHLVQGNWQHPKYRWNRDSQKMFAHLEGEQGLDDYLDAQGLVQVPKGEEAAKYVVHIPSSPYRTPEEQRWRDYLIESLIQYRHAIDRGIENTIDESINVAFRDLLNKRQSWANDLVYSIGQVYDLLSLQKRTERGQEQW